MNGSEIDEIKLAFKIGEFSSDLNYFCIQMRELYDLLPDNLKPIFDKKMKQIDYMLNDIITPENFFHDLYIDK